ncbi:N-acetylmuramoyl-L-alanine amidase family protein [Pseudofulvibacter geojedonensis]|uniref:N-acetylmuramoyl-L-alanine amidase n=1 Tax=Pseudofulvibacter geojedonensis TaxID=1123758 RepID=A0ABW3I2T7_9FLAO
MKELRKDSFWVVILFLVVFFEGFTPVFAQQKHNKAFTIMIDPGHGGKDTGTPGTGRYKTGEKDIALDVSLALGKKLKAELSNVNVVYTRTTDVYPTLQGRAAKTNKADADLFISIHCNAQPLKNKKLGGPANGSETFVLGLHKNEANLEVAKRENSVIFLEENYEENYEGFDPNSPESLIALTLMQEEYLEQSIEIASYIENEFVVTAKRKSRGVKQAGFWVLSKTYMPSVLVELGFLTHLKEEKFLNSKKGKDVMTLALFKAIKKYVAKRVNVEKTQKSTGSVTSDSKDKGLVFKVQLAASSRELALKPYNFNGLDELSKEKTGKIYRYFTGATSSYSKIKEVLKQAKNKKYKDAYIVAYKNGKKISLSEAIK